MNRARVVIIADLVADRVEPTGCSTDLESVEASYLSEVRASLESSGFTTVVYHHPRQLVETSREHREDTVLSLWAGSESRNRKALVPSICETLGLCYVGADAYAQLLCADKAGASHFAHRHGWRTPESVVVETQHEVPLLDGVRPPLIVKPIREGGSIGILARNYCTSTESARALALELLQQHRQPVIAEEFIEGSEVSISLLGVGGDVQALGASRLEFNGSVTLPPGFIYGVEVKKAGALDRRWVPEQSVLNPELKARCMALFRSLSKIELLRVDGRIRDGEFVLLELTPDIHLGRRASFSQGLVSAGCAHEEWLAAAIVNARDAFRSGSARTR